MRSTPYRHYALYEPDASPDLTETGEYNSAIMGIDADMNAEETERKTADTEIATKLAAETKARTDADTALDAAYKAANTALSSRIDKAETDINANSADITGIKGLTYGTQHVNFVENSNGEYTSPALTKIADQISVGITGNSTWGQIEA